MRKSFVLFFLFFAWIQIFAQQPPVKNDTLKSTKKESPFVTGFYPVSFFDVDLRYLIKYNNYESFRFGIGGITNEKLFENFKIGGHVAYGIKDKSFKYSLGGNLLINKKNTWVNFYYVNDIKEIGSFNYITEAREYSVFEPRLVNIIQFYKHRTWRTGVLHQFSPTIFSEVRLARTKIDQIEDYTFFKDGFSYRNYHLSEATLAFQLNPKPIVDVLEDGNMETFDSFPKISFQVTKGIKDISKSDFNYTKLSLKINYHLKTFRNSSTQFLWENKIAFGDVPLTHLYHTSPNNPTKDEILQRFSVAGTESFETMFFGEFFSDKLTTFKVKHFLKQIRVSSKFKPELVLITKHALGSLDDREEHLGINFNTLDQIYSESGLEINKLFFGFGLSFAYRYGYYHLYDFEDNISFKFTFNLKL